jgi:hypothetical protein
MTTVDDKHVYHFGAEMFFLLDKSWSFVEVQTNTKGNMWCLLIFWIHLWWICLSPTILNPGGKPHMWTCTNIWALSSGIHESLKASWQTSELNLHNMAKWSPDTMLHNSIWEHKRRSWICSKDDSKASRNFIVTSRDGLSLINNIGWVWGPGPMDLWS